MQAILWVVLQIAFPGPPRCGPVAAAAAERSSRASCVPPQKPMRSLVCRSGVGRPAAAGMPTFSPTPAACAVGECSFLAWCLAPNVPACQNRRLGKQGRFSSML